MKLKNFYCLFRCDTELEKKYSVISAFNLDNARSIAFKLYGNYAISKVISERDFVRGGYKMLFNFRRKDIVDRNFRRA